MTSASGASFANGCVADAPGDKDVTIMLAVDVGERCNVIGCDCPAVGLGRARTCEIKFISRKRAWSSMTVFRQQWSKCFISATNILSQSVGVNGSILTVCAKGGSTCNETATY
jgi:hypothetical protein